jgi:hypothetical protein
VPKALIIEVGYGGVYIQLMAYAKAHEAHHEAEPLTQRIANEIAEIDRLIRNEETLRRCEFPSLPATSKPVKMNRQSI